MIPKSISNPNLTAVESAKSFGISYSSVSYSRKWWICQYDSGHTLTALGNDCTRKASIRTKTIPEGHQRVTVAVENHGRLGHLDKPPADVNHEYVGLETIKFPLSTYIVGVTGKYLLSHVAERGSD